MINYEGFVVFGTQSGKFKPIGVVNQSFERKAYVTEIPDSIKRFIVLIEDRRFYSHFGIDFKGILRAIYRNFKAMKIIEGGSSITQQLARNLINNNKKTISRKLHESIYAILLEMRYSKEDILTLYFNNVYFGNNVRGIRAASISYLGKDLFQLTESEYMYLLTILRGPNLYLKNSDLTFERFKLINSLLLKNKLISKNIYRKNLKRKLSLKNICLSNFKNLSIDFIKFQINEQNKTVYTTIENQFQDILNQFVANAKYPLSIILVRNEKVIACGSSYGSNYPFEFKSNVGSTLKPFIYTLARSNGIHSEKLYNSKSNGLNWPVREVENTDEFITLEKAFLKSNNNSFINVSQDIGFDNVKNFLSLVLDKNEQDFYPSSILGATKKGISIYELAIAYNRFFLKDLNDSKKECLSLMNKIFIQKSNLNFNNVYIKTGTTNNNEERIVVGQIADVTFAALRNENPINDISKSGGFISNIINFIIPVRSKINNYKWR